MGRRSQSFWCLPYLWHRVPVPKIWVSAVIRSSPGKGDWFGDAVLAKVFVDGEAGTTGLQIAQRLANHPGIEHLRLSSADRKDSQRRAELLNSVDLRILCLPDGAARAAVALIDNDAVKVIDTSTAHRVASGWTYGFPEYSPDNPGKIVSSARVSNPGCHAIAAIAILHPLRSSGLLAADYPVTIGSVSGYSGGGKELINAFEGRSADHAANHYVYGLGLEHKHLAEITRLAQLDHVPVLTPSVGRFRQGRSDLLIQFDIARICVARLRSTRAAASRNDTDSTVAVTVKPTRRCGGSS